jgi:YD repeat-containing protein
MKKALSALIACLFVMCGLGAMALAQSDPCLHYATGIQQPFPAGFSFANCTYQTYSFGSYTCVFYSCPPKAAKEETRDGDTCPYCSSSGTRPNASKPISLVTGDTYIAQTDVRIPGLSNGLTLARTWNSMWPSTQTAFQTGLFGPNWRSTYEERVFMGSDSYVKYARSDGSFWSFGGAVSLYPVAPSNVTTTLTADSAQTQWTLTFQNGEKRIFSYASGSLTSIVDRNGNTTQLSYDGLNRLVTVSDPGGRHLYFGYANSSSRLVTSVTSDIGLSLTYTYDSQGRLIQVTKPDQTTLSFQYDSNSMITAVKDSDGKILESHTYDSCGRGLTGSRAGGVEAVTVTYPNPVCNSQTVQSEF